MRMPSSNQRQVQKKKGMQERECCRANCRASLDRPTRRKRAQDTTVQSLQEIGFDPGFLRVTGFGVNRLLR
jgi:hypothetical protein